MKVTCPCGVTFEVTQKRVAEGRGRYCSRPCMYQYRVRPSGLNCERCGEAVKTEWANLSHEYRRDPEDWAALCKLCHRRHDSGEAWGLATAKYGRRAVQRGYR